MRAVAVPPSWVASHEGLFLYTLASRRGPLALVSVQAAHLSSPPSSTTHKQLSGTMSAYSRRPTYMVIQAVRKVRAPETLRQAFAGRPDLRGPKECCVHGARVSHVKQRASVVLRLNARPVAAVLAHGQPGAKPASAGFQLQLKT